MSYGRLLQVPKLYDLRFLFFLNEVVFIVMTLAIFIFFKVTTLKSCDGL